MAEASKALLNEHGELGRPMTNATNASVVFESHHPWRPKPHGWKQSHAEFIQSIKKAGNSQPVTEW